MFLKNFGGFDSVFGIWNADCFCDNIKLSSNYKIRKWYYLWSSWQTNKKCEFPNTCSLVWLIQDYIKLDSPTNELPIVHDGRMQTSNDKFNLNNFITANSMKQIQTVNFQPKDGQFLYPVLPAAAQFRHELTRIET